MNSHALQQLTERKRLLVAEADLHRGLIQAEVNRCRSRLETAREGVRVGGPWLAAGSAIAGVLLGLAVVALVARPGVTHLVIALSVTGWVGYARVARAERANLLNFRDDEEFLAFYLNSLREAAVVDINDFEIRERRGGAVAPFLLKLKRTIWSLLKFYTYRMWSQQNSVNGLLVTGLESIHERYDEKIKRLEARVVELETNLTKEISK